MLCEQREKLIATENTENLDEIESLRHLRIQAIDNEFSSRFALQWNAFVFAWWEKNSKYYRINCDAIVMQLTNATEFSAFRLFVFFPSLFTNQMHPSLTQISNLLEFSCAHFFLSLSSISRLRNLRSI